MVGVAPAGPTPAGTRQAHPPLLRYDKPAAAFEEALPLGNGRLGAMVFGGPASERIMLNESTLWTGGPIDPAVNPEAVDVPAEGARGPVQGRLQGSPTS